MCRRSHAHKAGATAVATTPVIFGSVGLPGAVQALRCCLEGTRRPETPPDNPPVTLMGSLTGSLLYSSFSLFLLFVKYYQLKCADSYRAVRQLNGLSHSHCG